uniref:LMBR1-like membrane protein n=1 Tax=Physcomitrium patens TaxID=3218 RepID=A0A2K1L881_PHYPA|nr:hypothetical protein PHYPA_000667 [Physcomitrium patens]
MWVFYALAGPIALGMVTGVLQYFAARTVPLHVRVVVGYAWLCAISIIVLVPADIWTTVHLPDRKPSIATLWSWSYWSTFYLTWFVVPTLQGYEDAGDFTVSKRLKTSIHQNFSFYGAVGFVGSVGVLIMIFMNKLHWDGLLALAIACSNTFGLVTGAFLLGFGLVEIPRSMWRNANMEYRQKYLTHKIARCAVKLDDAHQELSTAIVIAQATSNQMPSHDILRPCMDVIDDMMVEMYRGDPAFKPSGGRMGENDMDYDQNEKSMAALRRRLRKAQSAYYRYKSDYTLYIWEALELEEIVKNVQRGSNTDGRFVSTIRPQRTGPLADFLDRAEYVWCSQLKQYVVKISAIFLGTMSLAIVMAEATLMVEADLSLLSLLLRAVGNSEILVQVVAFVPLAYMCVCTYFSLIKLGMMTIYYLAPKQTSSVSLLMICSMIARYAAPLCYNFLGLIKLKNADGTDQKTVFEDKMGSMTVIPFIGDERFNTFYPIFMVIYTGLLASNVLNRTMSYFGSWRYFRSRDAEDGQGFDPLGLVILRKERSWLQQGAVVGENVVPLARNFGSAELDVEPEGTNMKDLQQNSSLISAYSAPPDKHEGSAYYQYGRVKNSPSKSDIVSKYATLRDVSKAPSSGNHKIPKREPSGNNIRDPFEVQHGELTRGVTPSTKSPEPPASTDLQTASPRNPQQLDSSVGIKFPVNWDIMKSGWQNLGTNRFSPERNDTVRSPPQPTSTQTLDRIFEGLRARN